MKKNLIQLIWISRSTFLSVSSIIKVEPQIVRILSQSKINNRKNGIFGVLFFGDGCFFECLEGEEKEIDALYQVLLKDSRHKDVRVISRKKIDYLSFQKWSMKYVHFDASIKKLLTQNGFTGFDPYAFDREMMAKTLQLFHIADEANIEADYKNLKGNILRWAFYLPVIVMTLYLMKLLISFN